MLNQKSHWIVVTVIFFITLTVLGVSMPTEAHAAATVQVSENSCLSCHEDLYYLYDTGCWYCMTDAHKDRCVDCHEGNPAAVKEEDAHFGLVKHPQENDGSKCLECHTAEEKNVMLSTFESAHGKFDTVIEAKAYTPSQRVETGFPAVDEENPFTERAGWLVFGSMMFVFWLVLMLRS